MEEEKQKKEEEKKEAYRKQRGICVDCFSYNGTTGSGGSSSSSSSDGGAASALLAPLYPMIIVALASHLTTCTINEISCQAVNILSTYVPVHPQYLLLLVTPLITFVILILIVKSCKWKINPLLLTIPLAGCCLLKWYLLSVMEVGFIFFTLEILGFYGFFCCTAPESDGGDGELKKKKN